MNVTSPDPCCRLTRDAQAVAVHDPDWSATLRGLHTLSGCGDPARLDAPSTPVRRWRRVAAWVAVGERRIMCFVVVSTLVAVVAGFVVHAMDSDAGIRRQTEACRAVAGEAEFVWSDVYGCRVDYGDGWQQVQERSR